MKIQVQVHPKSTRPRVIKGADNGLHIYVNQPALEDRANRAAVEALARHFQVGRLKVRLVAGRKAKRKMFEIL